MPRKKRKVDFDDEDSVLAEMADALDIDADDLKIESAVHFGISTYEITIRRQGHKEWQVVENEDEERELALAIVKQDLEESPENFEQNFIESHIDTDRLRRDLESDVRDMRIEDLESMDADDFWGEWERDGRNLPEDVYEEEEDDEEEDEQGDARDPTRSEIEELAESHVEEQLKDPMSYLEEVYGREDAVKKAIEIAGIDIDAAAEEAVNVDGAAHFLSSYDGQSYETPGGLVYWRVN